MFPVDTSSSLHTDNCRNKFIVLGETYGFNGSFDSLDRKFSINFTKTKAKCCLNLHYNHDNSYLFGNGKF